MKFAFSTLATGNSQAAQVAAIAQELGYDGVELFCAQDAPTGSRAAAWGEALTARQLSLCCLATTFAFTHSSKQDLATADSVRGYLDLAKQLNCPTVRMLDSQVRAGQTLASTGGAFSDWLLSLGDYAAERGVTLVIKNALSFRSARDLWLVLEQANHPAVACCWDVFNAALIGQSPLVSVPVLNNRIQHVQVKDATLTGGKATLAPLGEGDVAVRPLLLRLRGIGYKGWVSYEPEANWIDPSTDATALLAEVLGKLKGWDNEGVKTTGPAGKPAASHAKVAAAK